MNSPHRAQPAPAYSPRTERHRSKERGRLRLRDASAMAIGGMIGGGIFSVLGVTIELAGHLAFLCFVLAGAVAGVTAHSYASLARRSRRSGGPDRYLREQGHPELATIASWLLVLGYVLALAVYAFTFGHYLESLTGGGALAARIAAAALLGMFLAINVRGVAASSLTEDAIVATKLVVLAVISIVGLSSWSGTRLEPLSNVGVSGVFVGAGLIFVAYEGFELLSYDYDDIDDADRTLPRALYLSVAAVAAVYVVVTLGAQMLVDDRLIVAQREAAFAAVGAAALGETGRLMAVGGAVLATASAVNATLFSTSRLVRDIAEAGELPAVVGRTRGGLPVTAIVLLAAFGTVFAMLPTISALLSFGSVTFLAVFALINHLHARTADDASGRVLGHVGTAACVAAIAAVAVHLAQEDPASLMTITALVVAVLGLRQVHRRRAHRT